MTPLDTSDFPRRHPSDLCNIVEAATRALAELASAGEAERVEHFVGSDILSPAEAGGLAKLEASTITRKAQEGAVWARQPGGPGTKWIISRSLFLTAFGLRA